MKQSIVLVAAGAAGTALAHSGHGMPSGTHWHAGDAASIGLIVLVALLALWLARSK
jgi:hypothetical protein